MSVRCAKCGEELLGAVNRCWKCGQTFDRSPDIDGQPPIRVDWHAAPGETLEAVVLDESSPPPPAAAPGIPPKPGASVSPYAAPRPRAAPPSTSELVEAHRQSVMAMGGTVTALVLAVFSLILSFFRFEAAVIALIGLVMGVWGLYSPRRRWALAAMLLCALAMALGTYRGVRDLYIYIKDQQTIEYTAPSAEEQEEP
jgi:hypothetical protein